MSLIGKILNTKKQNFEILIQFIPTQWKMQDRITSNNLANGKILFNLLSIEDLQAVLGQGPFHYNLCMFVLVHWEPTVCDDYPWIISFWVEITGTSLYLWTVMNLKNIGGKLGHIDIFELSAGRLLIDVDTRNPLVFSRNIKSLGGKEVTIKITYDLSFKHCTYYGSLSHEVSYCTKKMEETQVSARLGVFANVQLPQDNHSRQSLLWDHKGRCRHLDRNDRLRSGTSILITLSKQTILSIPFIIDMREMQDMTFTIGINQGIDQGIIMILLGLKVLRMDVVMLPMILGNYNSGGRNNT